MVINGQLISKQDRKKQSLQFVVSNHTFFFSLFSNELSHFNPQRSIFYVEGKESQKDILRLQALEQAKHENGSTVNAASSSASDEAQSSTTPDVLINNGYPLEAMVQSEN